MDGSLNQLLGEDKESVEFMALVVEDPEILERSKVLHASFKRSGYVYSYGRMQPVTHPVKLQKEAIINGELAFHFQGDNLLELLLSNWPPHNIEEPMSWLLSGGASVNQCSNDGCTPLQAACDRGLGKLGLILLQHGAKAQEVFPSGDDALLSVLKFFEKTKPRTREEDLDLARLSCALRASKIDKSLSGKVNELEEARLALSQAALELGLLAPAGHSIDKKKIFERANCKLSDSEELWQGWPCAFFTFADKISKDSVDWDPFFSRVRKHILSHEVTKAENIYDVYESEGCVYLG